MTNKLWSFPLILFCSSVFVDVSSQGVEKLKISLFYEALCPDCIQFDSKQLYPLYEQIPEYIDLELVPYGNARVRRHFSCPFKCHLYY